MRFPNSLPLFASLLLAADALAQSCNVDVSPIVFGTVDSDSGADVDSVGSLGLDCDVSTAFLVRLDAGLNSSSFLARAMRLVGDITVLQYNLFRDAARTMVWGDGTGGSSVVTGVSSGFGESIPIYGRVPGGQHPAPGSYADTITITIEY